MESIILSIITVNFNNNEGLKRTLQSIKQQSFSSFENIIIDAGSTDGSLDTILQYKNESSHLTYWHSKPDKGIYDGMNQGIEQANGQYLYFLNSGDCLTNDILKEIPFDGTQFIYGNTKAIINQKKTKTYTPPAIPDLIYLCNNSLPHQSCFIHQSLFKNKRYETDYKIISDWAHYFHSLIIEQCSFRYLPLLISEVDGNGVSSDRKKLTEERKKWFINSFPPILSYSFLSCAEIDNSGFRSILPLLGSTRKFKKRMRNMVLFFYKINTLFSISDP